MNPRSGGRQSKVSQINRLEIGGWRSTYTKSGGVTFAMYSLY